MADMVELSCPKCHMRFRVDAAALNAPPGQVAKITCTKCRHKADASKFADERERERRAAAKAAEREEREREAENRRRFNEAQRQRQRTEREAEKAAEMERLQAAARAREQERREHEERVRARREAEEQAKLAPAECPVCQQPCSRRAVRCMRCGHPFGSPSGSDEWAKEGRRLADEARGVRTLGTVLACLGLLSGVIAGMAMMRRGAEGLFFLGIVYGVAAAIPGIIIRALGGVWRSIQRVEERV